MPQMSMSLNSFALPQIGQRINVVGVSGSGKTTLAHQLANYLNVPHIELDALHWNPDWEKPPVALFRARVADVLSAPAWTVDGDYSKSRDLVWARADTIIWLDYTLSVILIRLLKRTLRRVITQQELWNGNRENWRSAFFSRDSLFLWAIKTYPRRKREYPQLFKQPEYTHLVVIRLSSPRAASRWLADLTRATTSVPQ